MKLEDRIRAVVNGLEAYIDEKRAKARKGAPDYVYGTIKGRIIGAMTAIEWIEEALERHEREENRCPTT